MEQWREELYHHGIKGMQWGHLNGPPYPLRDGDHSAAEKKANGTGFLKRMVEKRTEAKKKKKRQEAAARARQAKANKAAEEKRKRDEEEAQKRHEQELQDRKQEALRSGSAKDVMREYKGKLSNDELQYLSNRYRLESEITARIPVEQKGYEKTLETMKTIGNAISDVTTFAQSTIKAYNTGVAVVNAFTGSSYKQINLGNQGGKKKK